MTAAVLAPGAFAATPRGGLVAAIVDGLDRAGVAWAFQGADDAPDRWIAASGTTDLDLWVASADLDAAAAVLGALGGARVVAADDPRRLRHQSWWFDCDGPAIVDLTVGDLRVGPLCCCPEAEVRTVRSGGRPRLDGGAAAVDLVVRPLLRGRVPEPGRMAEARRAWAGAPATARATTTARLWAALGRRLAGEVTGVLAGAPVSDALAARARRRLARATASPAGLRAAAAQWATIVPTRRSGPAGVRTAGTLVVLCGTDGSGKSTVARDLTETLEARGYRVRDAYFGMARGNLPGVGLARRVLGVAPAGDQVAADPAAADRDDVDRDAAATAHPRLRRLAAWYYALEYGWRFTSSVLPGLLARDVVVCDRYVYDLRWSPAPGSRAEQLARVLTGRPHVLAVPDAPAETIRARKPERSVEAIRAQQRGFRDLVAAGVASRANLVVDTSGRSLAPVDPLVRVVIEASHRRTVHAP